MKNLSSSSLFFLSVMWLILGLIWIVIRRNPVVGIVWILAAVMMLVLGLWQKGRENRR